MNIVDYEFFFSAWVLKTKQSADIGPSTGSVFKVVLWQPTQRQGLEAVWRRFFGNSECLCKLILVTGLKEARGGHVLFKSYTLLIHMPGHSSLAGTMKKTVARKKWTDCRNDICVYYIYVDILAIVDRFKTLHDEMKVGQVEICDWYCVHTSVLNLQQECRPAACAHFRKNWYLSCSGRLGQWWDHWEVLGSQRRTAWKLSNTSFITNMANPHYSSSFPFLGSIFLLPGKPGKLVQIPEGQVKSLCTAVRVPSNSASFFWPHPRIVTNRKARTIFLDQNPLLELEVGS